MDPALLLPSPDAIPAPWGWFQALLLLTFFCHILLMNVMLGTACIALADHFGTGGERAAESHRLAGALPFTIAFAVNFGVAPLLFVQVLYGQFVYVSSILMASFWLAVIALLIAAYAAAYLYKYRYDRLGGAPAVFVAEACIQLAPLGAVLGRDPGVDQVTAQRVDLNHPALLRQCTDACIVDVARMREHVIRAAVR